MVTVKEIQAGYLGNSYFKDIYLYLALNKLPSSKAAKRKIEVLVEKYILLDSLLFKISATQDKETAVLAIPRNMCRQHNCFISFKFICRTPRCN